jgi:hypothetical protein
MANECLFVSQGAGVLFCFDDLDASSPRYVTIIQLALSCHTVLKLDMAGVQ